jgi:hypothetical protein
MHSRATPAQIKAVDGWLLRCFPGCTVESEDDFARSLRMFRVDGPNSLPVANLEIHAETFLDETGGEIAAHLTAGRYWDQLVKADLHAVLLDPPPLVPVKR